MASDKRAPVTARAWMHVRRARCAKLTQVIVGSGSGHKQDCGPLAVAVTHPALERTELAARVRTGRRGSMTQHDEHVASGRIASPGARMKS